jgi:hypothetical protein
MDTATRDFVRQRADGQCEYCHARQEDEPFFRFQIEHIVARQHGGESGLENLALACPHCNLHKGPNLAGIDSDLGGLVPLFNPRTQSWEEHFRLRPSDGVIVGKSVIGRVTVQVMNMNHPIRRAARRRP